MAKTVLVTFGGCREPIDNVRFISNFSTGKTGSIISDKFVNAGWEVTCLSASGSVPLQSTPRAIMKFQTFASLENQLFQILTDQHFDLIIHAAAVSDYSVGQIRRGEYILKPDGKIPSGEQLVLTLNPNPKLLPLLKKWSKNKNATVVGFKLTDTSDVSQQTDSIGALFDSGGIDYVVHNDLSGLGAEKHKGCVYSFKNAIVEKSFSFSTKEDLAKYLVEKSLPASIKQQVR